METINKGMRLVLVISIILMLQGCYTIGESPTLLAQQKPQPKPTPVPVLYVDGIGIPYEKNDSSPRFNLENWPELFEMFENNGYDLKVAGIEKKGKIDGLSDQLCKEVKRIFTPDTKFHIVAKSMGGLVTRRMLNKEPELEKRVLSVTTIATPHWGSPFATVLVDEKERHTGSVIQEFILSITTSLFPDDEQLESSAEDLKVESMCKFNKENPYNPDIPFFSLGFNIKCDDIPCKLWNFFLPNYPVNFFSGYSHDEIAIQNKGKSLEDIMNDGFVPVSSAKWGTYLGTFEGEHGATTQPPASGIFSYYPMKLFTYLSPITPTYRYQYIWKDVFEKVIVNLNHMKNKAYQIPLPNKNIDTPSCERIQKLNN